MTVTSRNRWKLPARWTAKNAAHRALENARAFSTTFHRLSCERAFTKAGGTRP
jgi:hypothetical protein